MDQVNADKNLGDESEDRETVRGWQPIETAPEDGLFLVYMPNEPPHSMFQVARWHPNAKVIGHVFAFDLTKPTHWMPLPSPPDPPEVKHGNRNETQGHQG